MFIVQVILETASDQYNSLGGKMVLARTFIADPGEDLVLHINHLSLQETELQAILWETASSNSPRRESFEST